MQKIVSHGQGWKPKQVWQNSALTPVKIPLVPIATTAIRATLSRVMTLRDNKTAGWRDDRGPWFSSAGTPRAGSSLRSEVRVVRDGMSFLRRPVPYANGTNREICVFRPLTSAL